MSLSEVTFPSMSNNKAPFVTIKEEQVKAGYRDNATIRKVYHIDVSSLRVRDIESFMQGVRETFKAMDEFERSRT